MSTETTTGTGARQPPDSLLPGELRERIPALYATEAAADPIVHAKLFTPWTTWTWCVTESDGQEAPEGFNEAAAANGHHERKPPSPFHEPGIQ